MPMILPSVRRLVLPLALLLTAGCDDKTTPVDTLPRQPVSGTVSLDGKPLPDGKIQFDPADGSKGPTAVAVADIKDGKFSIEKAQGPVPGQYKVSITSRPSAHIDAGDMPGTAPKREPEKIPAKYNTSTTLAKDVAAGSANVFDFPLVSK
jgi:hypothetical protein